MLPESDWQSVPRRFRYLSKFVDRVTEYGKFESFVQIPVDKRDKFILAFYGRPGIGKTMLLQRLEFECSKRNIANVRIVLDLGGDINSPIEIMRGLASQLGESEFARWFELEKYWSSPPDINIQAQRGSINIDANHAEFHQDIVAGSKIQISNSQFNTTTRAALNLPAAQNALTQTFLQVLGEFVKNKAAVIIFDGFDSEEFALNTRRWLTNSLLDKARDLGGYGVLPIVALIERPDFSDPSLQDDTASFLLRPLTREHIIEYLQMRNVPDEIIGDVAETCLSQSEGIPSRVYGFVEALFNPPDET